jgi:hypothetical protein
MAGKQAKILSNDHIDDLLAFDQAAGAQQADDLAVGESWVARR